MCRGLTEIEKMLSPPRYNWFSLTRNSTKASWDRHSYCWRDPRVKKSRNITDLRSFPGLCHISRRFAPYLACIAAFLHHKLQRDQSMEFGSLNNEKAHSNDVFSGKMFIFSYLSAAIRWRIFYIGHRRMQWADRLRTTIRPNLFNKTIKHLLVALIDKSWTGLRHHSTRVLSTRLVYASCTSVPQRHSFIICSDHDSLGRFLNLADATGRLARWWLFILKFDLTLSIALTSSNRQQTPYSGYPKMVPKNHRWMANFEI